MWFFPFLFNNCSKKNWIPRSLKVHMTSRNLYIHTCLDAYYMCLCGAVLVLFFFSLCVVVSLFFFTRYRFLVEET
jgi:hypothetical protein